MAALLVAAAGGLTGLLELRSFTLLLALVAQLAAIAYLPFHLEAQDVGTLNLPATGWAAGWLLAFLGTGLAARAIGSEQRRFAHDALGKYLPADVAKKHDTGGLFTVPLSGPESDDARARGEAGTLSATGPMFGAKMRWPEGEPAALEREVAELRARLEQLSTGAS